MLAYIWTLTNILTNLVACFCIFCAVILTMKFKNMTTLNPSLQFIETAGLLQGSGPQAIAFQTLRFRSGWKPPFRLTPAMTLFWPMQNI